MDKIGNIFYFDDLVNHEKVDYINYIDKNTHEGTINGDNPTLYVGWDKIKEQNKNNETKITILDKEIEKNKTYWEFSFKENKSEHVSGVNMFAHDVPFYYFTSKYNYINLDPNQKNIYTLKDLRYYLPPIDFYYQYKNEMLYVISDNNIFGIDLKMYEFFKIDTKNIIEELNLKNNRGMIDQDGETYQSYYKSFPDFDFLKRYLIVLLEKNEKT
jgi:hypothetical protein